MKIIKWILRILLFLLAIPIGYTIVSLLISLIPVGQKESSCEEKHLVYFSSSNLVHSDLILPVDLLSPELKAGLVLDPGTTHLAFGWGDKQFYANTPTWGDLTLKNAWVALMVPSESAMHVIRLTNAQKFWYPLNLCEKQLAYLNEYILRRFKTKANGEKIHLDGLGYGPRDDFYLAKGNFSCFFTCNSWVNEGLKYIGKPACLWTPFSLGLQWKYPKPK